jgi:hypothetical protein
MEITNTTGITKAKFSSSPYYSTERTIQMEDRSLVPSGTTQMEGWKTSPIKEYKNGRLEA